MVVIKLPAPPRGLATNLLGLLGLVAVALAVGGLAGWWWAALVGGLFAFGLSVLAQYQAQVVASESGEGQPAQVRHLDRAA